MRHLFVVAAAAAATVAVPLERAAAQGAPFASARVVTDGMKVGYHYSAEFRVRVNDIPNNCEFANSATSYDGELPPGIAFHPWDSLNGGGDIPFTGTPRQPGTWRGTLEAIFQCTTGPDINRYTRRIQVTFVVTP